MEIGGVHPFKVENVVGGIHLVMSEGQKFSTAPPFETFPNKKELRCLISITHESSARRHQSVLRLTM